jgi:membrane protein DedA with SNARE-associated domain
LTSDLLIHLFGKKYGQKIVSHKKFQKFISPERLQLIENKFNRFGLLLILAGRHIAGLRAQIFLVSGAMKMPTLRFILADALSSIFTILIMVGAGYIGGNSLNIIKKDMAKIGHIAILLILVTLTAYLIFRFFKAKRQ